MKKLGIFGVAGIIIAVSAAIFIGASGHAIIALNDYARASYYLLLAMWSISVSGVLLDRAKE